MSAGTRSLLPLGVLTIAACALPRHPDPSPGKSQILVTLAVLPKAGMGSPRKQPGSSYSGRFASVEEGASYQRVDYQDMRDLVVLIDGATVPQAHAPLTARLVAATRDALVTFDHEQVLIAPGGQLTLHNAADHALHFFATSEAWQWLEIAVEPGADATVSVPESGAHGLWCEDHATLQTTVVCAMQGSVGKSGDDLWFDDVTPGNYHITVIAPRLPWFEASVVAGAGERESVAARLGVNDLPDGRAHSRTSGR